jgi:apolipoprotein N-acyltransferase
VAERESAERPVSVVGDLPVGITSTIYSRVGDVFARVMIFVWAAFAALLVLRHSSGAPAVPPSAKSAL